VKWSFILLLFSLFINSCSYPKLIGNELFYQNDFENSSFNEIDGAIISSYNNTNVIGDYNNGGFTLHLKDLPDHHYMYISFDLYIHGSWDGNKNGFSEEIHGFKDKPDLWIMELEPGIKDHSNLDFKKFQTTFSNSPCFTNYCLRQSYPNTYPFSNSPKKGAVKIGLKEHCITDGWNNQKTTLYKIEKGFNHNNNALIVRFYDQLFQPNAINSKGETIEKCDESWSLDNLKIRLITYD